MLAGILAKLAQVLHVALQGACLSVAGTVAVIGENPSEGHVVGSIAVDHGASRELVAAIGGHAHLAASTYGACHGYRAVYLLAIEGLSDAAIVLLALAVALAILEGHAALGSLYPIVTVIGVEVAFVETKLGQQHGVTGELVEVAQ